MDKNYTLSGREGLRRMKKYLLSIVASALVLSPFGNAEAHSGRLDSNGGHNCSQSSVSKGLCTGYHYHNGSSSSSSTTTTTAPKTQVPAPVVTPTQKPVISPAPIYQTADVKVVLDNKELAFTQNPVIINGRTLVPLRTIFEALGATVAWDANTRTVTATKEGTTVKLTVGQTTAYKNDEAVIIDVAPVVINGSTLVPARFASQALGAVVGWNAAIKTIIIDTQAVNEVTVKVVRIVDGDTLKVELNGKEETVRLIGVDTPETVHPTKGVEPYGKEASDYTKLRLEGQEVKLEFDVQERDQYGRTLVYVWFGSEMFNKTLLIEGYAQIATFPPNVRYVEDFKKLQEQSREAKKGMWEN